MEIIKHIQIRIEGEDVETLKDICELARRFIAANKVTQGDSRTVREYGGDQLRNLEAMMQSIFDA